MLLVKKRVFYFDDGFTQGIRKRKAGRLVKKNSQVVKISFLPRGPNSRWQLLKKRVNFYFNDGFGIFLHFKFYAGGAQALRERRRYAFNLINLN